MIGDLARPVPCRANLLEEVCLPTPPARPRKSRARTKTGREEPVPRRRRVRLHLRCERPPSCCSNVPFSSRPLWLPSRPARGLPARRALLPRGAGARRTTFTESKRLAGAVPALPMEMETRCKAAYPPRARISPTGRESKRRPAPPPAGSGWFSTTLDRRPSWSRPFGPRRLAPSGRPPSSVQAARVFGPAAPLRHPGRAPRSGADARLSPPCKGKSLAQPQAKFYRRVSFRVPVFRAPFVCWFEDREQVNLIFPISTSRVPLHAVVADVKKTKQFASPEPRKQQKNLFRV